MNKRYRRRLGFNKTRKRVYHHGSKKHLPRYLNEFTFRLDQGDCAIDTIDKVNLLLKNSVKKRLNYTVLTV